MYICIYTSKNHTHMHMHAHRHRDTTHTHTHQSGGAESSLVVEPVIVRFKLVQLSCQISKSGNCLAIVPFPGQQLQNQDSVSLHTAHVLRQTPDTHTHTHTHTQSLILIPHYSFYTCNIHQTATIAITLSQLRDVGFKVGFSEAIFTSVQSPWLAPSPAVQDVPSSSPPGQGGTLGGQQWPGQPTLEHG